MVSFFRLLPPQPEMPITLGEKTGWATTDDVTPSAVRWWWSDGLRIHVCVFIGVVKAGPGKELLLTDFCVIIPNLPLNIHTSVCEVTYGVIVICQWVFTRTTLSCTHSMEHSKPLMVSNGEWHQSCHVPCYFSLFLIISVSNSLSLCNSLLGVVNGSICELSWSVHW